MSVVVMLAESSMTGVVINRTVIIPVAMYFTVVESLFQI
jgi:hypothetical protein